MQLQGKDIAPPRGTSEGVASLNSCCRSGAGAWMAGADVQPPCSAPNNIMCLCSLYLAASLMGGRAAAGATAAAAAA